ncbi:uncharacterized protein TNCV_1747771 [Trichonephila clavipes]|nr:uncharacterized protein TNCV_1747771 [Trichonephila clavipes]
MLERLVMTYQEKPQQWMTDISSSRRKEPANCVQQQGDKCRGLLWPFTKVAFSVLNAASFESWPSVAPFRVVGIMFNGWTELHAFDKIAVIAIVRFPYAPVPCSYQSRLLFDGWQCTDNVPWKTKISLKWNGQRSLLIYFQWILSPVNFAGNEIADSLDRAGAVKTTTAATPLTYLELFSNGHLMSLTFVDDIKHFEICTKGSSAQASPGYILSCLGLTRQDSVQDPQLALDFFRFTVRFCSVPPNLEGENPGGGQDPPTSPTLPPTTREDLRLDGYLEYPHAAKVLYKYKHPCLLRDSNPVPTAPQSASQTGIPVGLSGVKF